MTRGLVTLAVLALLVLGSAAVSAEWSEPMAWEHCVPSVDRMPWIAGNTLYFARDYNIFYSEYDEILGTWSEPQPVPGPINTGANEISPALARGGKVLYFGRYDPITDYDFYRSEWDEAKGEWGEPVLIEEISTDIQDWDIWVSDDETLIYLTTKGAFGDAKSLGGRDIWKSTWDGSKWTTPVNIGAPINTEGDEWSVFVGPDGRIYTDGNRNGSQGGYDLWVAADEKSEPENLGVPFNSPGDERSVFINDSFFFISTLKREGGPGGYDLFYSVKE